MEGEKKSVMLFDVDGTLTVPRNKIKQDMIDFLRSIKDRATIAIVGGSDFNKISEQVGADFVKEFPYVFSENGLVWYKNAERQPSNSVKQAIPNDKLKEFINFCLKYIADLDIPIKRGTFVEFRTGMLNVSPIGRNCSQEERDEFEKYDKEHGIRTEFVKTLREKFADLNLTFAIGGQISFDVFPNGWDKTYCLQFLKADGYNNVHFFGDKTFEGGNDYEIYESSETFGHSVKGPEDTIEQVKGALEKEGL